MSKVYNLEAGEKLTLTLLYVPGRPWDERDIEVNLNGPGAELDLAGLYLCPDGESLDIRVVVRHNSGACLSRQMFKGIVGGKSRASFDGLIYVAQDSQKTKAYQESHSILLSSEARAESRPQLEIYADDVECSHGATTGYLNPDEQFYMRSRGIPEQEAKRLQMISFLAPVTDRLDGSTRAEVLDILSRM
ncbi:MAG: SufD family Fe-S cluster assembly protein [Bacteroidales bacterium]|nr:SufD family Fe-S cluster assembly protein [Bacteroidales bacterium]